MNVGYLLNTLIYGIVKQSQIIWHIFLINLIWYRKISQVSFSWSQLRMNMKQYEFLGIHPSIYIIPSLKWTFNQTQKQFLLILIPFSNISIVNSSTVFPLHWFRWQVVICSLSREVDLSLRLPDILLTRPDESRRR